MTALAKTRLRILLLENNNLLRSMLHRLLLNQGWEVIGYPDPEGCPLHHATKCACGCTEVCADVIITDWEMPHVDGFTFVHDLLEKGCKVGYLAMFTGRDDAACLAQARALGFTVFSKSVGLTALLEWLHTVERLVNGGRLLTPWADLCRT